MVSYTDVLKVSYPSRYVNAFSQETQRMGVNHVLIRTCTSNGVLKCTNVKMHFNVKMHKAISGGAKSIAQKPPSKNLNLAVKYSGRSIMV